MTDNENERLLTTMPGRKPGETQNAVKITVASEDDALAVDFAALKQKYFGPLLSPTNSESTKSRNLVFYCGHDEASLIVKIPPQTSIILEPKTLFVRGGVVIGAQG